MLRKVEKSEDVKEILEDLSRSGLDKKDLQRLKLEPLSREQTDDFVGEPRRSYRIPYFDIDGKQTQYSRVRFLENSKGKGFSSRGKGNNGSFRYSQPFNSQPHVYFPPYMDWRKITTDPEIKIVITEGEKKAAKACKEEIACIALGGVWGFKSSKRLWDLIPELRSIDWKGRAVEVCFDSDVMVKQEVQSALQALALTLSQSYETASISFVFFDAEDVEKKTALDDFLMEHGAEGFERLKREDYSVGAKVHLLNQKIAYVEKHTRFYDIKNDVFFRSLSHAREAFLPEGEVMIDGKKTAHIFDLWAKSKSRRVIHDISYEPGQPEILEDNRLNSWVAPTITPRKANAKRWLDLVHFVMRKPEYAEWFLKWLAFPVQNPGSKLFSACFVHSKMQGSGKTFVVDPVMEFIHGEKNFHRLKSANLNSSFNEHAGSRTFVVVNEIYLPDYRDRRAAMGSLKDMITNEKTEVNKKFQPVITNVDRCNYYFSSNHDDALVLEKNERRLFVVHAPEDRLPESTYAELDEWIREGDGARVVLHYLQNRVDTSDFNPKGDALLTPYKKALITLGQDPLQEFAQRLVDQPEELLMVNGELPEQQLFRAVDILKLFQREYPKLYHVPTVRRMAETLKGIGLTRRNVRATSEDKQLNLYALFDKDGWAGRKNKAWAEHYKQHARIYGGKGMGR